jgi:hypothetical protein
MRRRVAPPTRRSRNLGAALLLLVVALLVAAACAGRKPPRFSRIPPAPPRLSVPSPSANLVLNGSFEEGPADSPAGWDVAGKDEPGARLRAIAAPGAPEGKRVAEVSMSRAAGKPSYSVFFHQDVRVRPWTTYDLSVWVRGIDLESADAAPRGYGQGCGLVFWLLGPDADWEKRLFPSGAFPRRDGTTPWELRKMRFTTPPADVFPPPAKGGDGRFKLYLQVRLHGTGAVQLDDLRLATSSAAPPPPRRDRGRLAFVRHAGRPFFGLGINVIPTDLAWSGVGRLSIFNFTTAGGSFPEKASLGIQSLAMPALLDPACGGCAGPAAAECPACRGCPEPAEGCDFYYPPFLRAPGIMGVWLDEQNFNPQLLGDLGELERMARRMKTNAARLSPFDRELEFYASDMPGGVYFNTYGWDDAARYHASEAFDIVATLRRGGNPKKGAVGGRMSEFPETSINGIRQSARRLADDVTDRAGRQGKPVWMLVNGGSGRLVQDPDDPSYAIAPHDAAELLASRPDLGQLRYMLYAAVLNGATGLHFYQDNFDTLLTSSDPYWTRVLVPAAAELATLERDTGFLTRADYNDLPYHLEGDAEAIDSMLKRSGDRWILVVANSSEQEARGVEFVLEKGRILAGPPERLTYRHAERAALRKLEASPTGSGKADRFLLDLPGYGVALYRFRLASRS